MKLGVGDDEVSGNDAKSKEALGSINASSDYIDFDWEVVPFAVANEDSRAPLGGKDLAPTAFVGCGVSATKVQVRKI